MEMERPAGLEFEKPIVELENKIAELKNLSENGGKAVDLSEEISALEVKCAGLKKEIFENLSPWQHVLLARHPQRPYTLDFINRIFDEFVELHGDRYFGDDKALVGGLGLFMGRAVVALGHQKGRTMQESMERNFGMPHPEGYRKALRLMKLAESQNMPVLCFIDTQGAYPGIGAEERGQAEAIARNLRTMSRLRVPIICCVIGEGGSGGALAIGIGDRLLMLENAWYSVITPEGCAAILFRDAARAPEAAEALKITAGDLKRFEIMDEIIPEPEGGAHRDPDAAAQSVKEALHRNLETLRAKSTETLLEERYQKYRRIGHYQESKLAQIQPHSKKGAHKKKPPR